MVNSNKEYQKPARRAFRSESMPVYAVSTASSFAVAPVKKSVEERGRLRKLVSLSYYQGKVKKWFHREDRDTIVCEEDEEAFRRANLYEIDEFDGSDERELKRRETAASAYSTWLDSSSSGVLVMQRQNSTTSTECESDYEPSKEQRWCTNCAKCFQRRLSHYDQFCGLDCKTAHRFRLLA
ncbi:hypothetical protein FI667_g12246, partial [Globisporangium splendens]